MPEKGVESTVVARCNKTVTIINYYIYDLCTCHIIWTCKTAHYVLKFKSTCPIAEG